MTNSFYANNHYMGSGTHVVGIMNICLLYEMNFRLRGSSIKKNIISCRIFTCYYYFLEGNFTSDNYQIILKAFRKVLACLILLNAHNHHARADMFPSIAFFYRTGTAAAYLLIPLLCLVMICLEANESCKES
ncbi:hypothetical protein ACJX0J_035634, partial [Zea mays]